MTEQECARRLAPLLAKALARADATRPVVEPVAVTPSARRADSPRRPGTTGCEALWLAAVTATTPAPGPCPVSARPAGPGADSHAHES